MKELLRQDIIASFGTTGRFALANPPYQSTQNVDSALATHEKGKYGLRLSTRIWIAKKMGISIGKFNKKYGYPR